MYGYPNTFILYHQWPSMELVLIAGTRWQSPGRYIPGRVRSGALGVCAALYGGLGAHRGHQRRRRAHTAACWPHDQVTYVMVIMCIYTYTMFITLSL